MRVPFVSVLCVGLAVLFSSCEKACDTDDVPRYPLTPGLRAWSASYSKDAVLRFRNDRTGYVRSYRVVTAENKTESVSGGGIDMCPSYYREYTLHVLQRTDSTGSSDNKELEFWLATDNSVRIKSRFRIGSSSIELPVPEVEDGTEVLSPATFAGRTYPAVLGRSTTLAGARPGVVLTLYVTKADGLIRFEERGGTAWNRL